MDRQEQKHTLIALDIGLEIFHSHDWAICIKKNNTFGFTQNKEGVIYLMKT